MPTVFTREQRIFLIQREVKQVEEMCKGDWDNAPQNPRIDWERVARETNKKFRSNFSPRSVACATGRARMNDELLEAALCPD